MEERNGAHKKRRGPYRVFSEKFVNPRNTYGGELLHGRFFVWYNR
jgi:hypothetical protein